MADDYITGSRRTKRISDLTVFIIVSSFYSFIVSKKFFQVRRDYTTCRTILAFGLVLTLDLLKDRRIDDVISNMFVFM